MPTKSKKPASTGPKPPPRPKMVEIIRRYLKEDRSPVWSRELPLAYTLWKAYPSLPFWERHTLAFKLNSLAWFMSIEGKATLASDYAVFHYNPEPAVEPLPVLDTTPQPAYHGDTAARPAPPPPKSVAGFLASKQ